MVRRKPERVDTEIIKIPRDFYALHHFVTLTADVMFVNGIPFLTTLSRKIQLRTAEFLPSRTASQLSKSLKKVMRLYYRGGFNVRVILMDMKFVKLADEFDVVEINTTAAREHVGEIERSHRTLKERARCVVAELPYNTLQMQMRIHLVYFVVLWLNAFPSKKGISDNLSPREIVTRKNINFIKHCKALFDSCVKAS